ncbi:periplasmic heavy metal sensor [Duganella sp. FT92W]|uniref:Periplasmic heavy metal sensor n=1 Tax=Pseudoduganella rivuli TaxID=2666085 RepID=A0A7X2IRZ8_9BURK|nr:periplasmic heavy metal sensor [Pseudoduganella rivuli]MRV74722.1 periplasmic heavy metal sensor [Pseudoduganella rivuli]
MKTKQNQIVQRIVLAAALALPFGVATADDVAAMPAPEGRMGPGPGHFGPGMQGGPGMPGRGPHAGGEGAPEGHGPQGRQGGPGGPRPMGPPPFLHGLNLTEAQQDKVFTILHGQAPYMREQDKALRKAHEALHALASSAQYDDARAASLSQAAAQAMTNLELARVRTDQKLLAVLTAEQRKQVEQRMAAMPQHGPRL